jgi:glutathione S-transferase
MTAEVLGVEYDYKTTNIMAGDNKKPEFLAINPMHNIPALKDGDFCLNESRAIAGYLVNKYGKDDSLYPKDAEARAIVDQRMYFDMGAFYKAFGDCVYPVMFGGNPAGEKEVDKLKEVLGWVDGFVKDGKFAAGGDNLTLADICLVATYSTLKATGYMDLSGYTNIASWEAKVTGLIPNFAKANQEGADGFGGFYKSKTT